MCRGINGFLLSGKYVNEVIKVSSVIVNSKREC